MKKITTLYDFLHVDAGLESVMQFQTRSLSKTYSVDVSVASIKNNMKHYFGKNIDLNEHSPEFINNSLLKIIFSFLNKSSLKNLKDRDLFISQSFICSRLADYMKQKFKIPHVVFFHHPPNFLYTSGWKWARGDIKRIIAYFAGILIGPILKKMDKKYMLNADLIFSNSRYTAKRFKEIYGIDSKILYPPIGDFFRIATDKDKRKIKEKYKLNNEFIFSYGRLIPDKGYDYLINCFKYLPKKIDIVLAGKIKEKYKQELILIAKKYNSEKKLRFLGFVSEEELVQLNSAASCFAFPALKEDFGLVPVEAMACGCPAVGWKDGAGPEETIIPNVGGFLAKPYNSEDFANKIKLCLNKRWDKKKITKSVNKFREKEIAKKFIPRIRELLQ